MTGVCPSIVVTPAAAGGGDATRRLSDSGPPSSRSEHYRRSLQGTNFIKIDEKCKMFPSMFRIFLLVPSNNFVSVSQKPLEDTKNISRNSSIQNVKSQKKQLKLRLVCKYSKFFSGDIL